MADTTIQAPIPIVIVHPSPTSADTSVALSTGRSSVSSDQSSSGDDDPDIELSVAVESLSNHELLILEAALRVQLELGKLARKKKARATLILIMSLHAFSPLMIMSRIKAKKLRQKYMLLADQARVEVLLRQLQPVVVDEEKRAERAMELNGSAGCALSFVPNVLLDETVLQVVCEAFMDGVGDFMLPHHEIRKVKLPRMEKLRRFFQRSHAEDDEDIVEVFGDAETGMKVRRIPRVIEKHDIIG